MPEVDRRVGGRQPRRVRHRRRRGATSIRERIAETKLNQARQELVGRVDRGAHRARPTSSRRRRSCRATCSGASRRRCASCSRRASAWSSGCRSPARTPAAFIEGMKGHVRAGRQGRPGAARRRRRPRQLDADDGDLAAEYERMALQFDQKPNQVRKAYEQNDLVPELVAQIRKSKALDWLLHHVEMVDPEGDRARPRPDPRPHPRRRARPRPRLDDDHEHDHEPEGENASS